MYDFSEAELIRVIDVVYKHTGVRLSVQKKTLLQRRLTTRMVEHKMESLTQYLDFIQGSSIELNRFIDAVTTHETYFHRTPRIWKFFEARVSTMFNSNIKMLR